MVDTYQKAVTNGCRVFHKPYCLYNDGQSIAYDRGAIRYISLDFPIGSSNAEIQVKYASGEVFSWKTKWLSSYTLQFGIAVSLDGKHVFAQTWENGLFCLNAHTGETVWRTKSRRGITSIFVNEDTVLCCQREHALQLRNIRTGEVISEKRPATAWGFTALDHQHIICQVTAKRWEILDAQTLETKESFSHKLFTGGHEDYAIHSIDLAPHGEIKVCGFKNVWDTSVKPAVMLPNLQFEHYVKAAVFNQG